MARSSPLTLLFAQRVVVGVGDLAVSNNAQTVLSTYALASCVGVVAYDPAVRSGGMLHLMLPESVISPEKAVRQPAMFADTGIVHLLRELTGIQAEWSRLRILVAGGASVISGSDPFRIGERNVQVTIDCLTRQGFGSILRETGGAVSRTLHLELGTGALTVKTPTESKQITLGE